MCSGPTTSALVGTGLIDPTRLLTSGQVTDKLSARPSPWCATLASPPSTAASPVRRGARRQRPPGKSEPRADAFPIRTRSFLLWEFGRFKTRTIREARLCREKERFEPPTPRCQRRGAPCADRFPTGPGWILDRPGCESAGRLQPERPPTASGRMCGRVRAHGRKAVANAAGEGRMG